MKRIGIVLTALLAIHCGSSEVGNPLARLSRVDISDARTLYVSSEQDTSSRLAANRRAESDTSSADSDHGLFKVTEDGKVEVVQYLDDEGNAIEERIPPIDIQNVNDDYLVMNFLVPGYMGNDLGLLVRKSDGAVFRLEGPAGGENLNGLIVADTSPFSTDASGNIYYQFENDILKIDVSDPDELTWEKVNPAGDPVGGRGFAVDKNGVIVYQNQDDVVRIVKTNGSVENMPVEYSPLWKGLDGRITSISFHDCCAYVDKMSVNQNQVVSFSNYGMFPEDANTVGYIDELLKLDDRLFVIGSGSILEAENPLHSPREIILASEFDNEILKSRASGTQLYILGKSASKERNIVRFDPSDDSETELLNPAQIEVSGFDVSSDNNVSFHGLRFSDGAHVVGEIDANGEITILSAEQNDEITALVRIR